MNPGTAVIGYTRCSTTEQHDSHAGLDAQRSAIERECAHRGWVLVEVVEEVASAKSMRRPKLNAALARVEAGEAAAVVVAKLDRLSRSVIDFANLMRRAEKQGWRIVILDLNIDTQTPHGAMIVHVLAALSEWERRMIGQRTREGMAERKRAGVRMGAPPKLDPRVRAVIMDAHRSGRSANAIAITLNESGVPAVQGGKWSRQAVIRVTRSPHST